MRVESHSSLQLATVHDHAIARHGLVKLGDGRAFVLTTGIGQPRTWGFTREPLVAGFEAGLEEGAQMGPKERVRHAFGAARARLVTCCNALIEQRVPDSSLAALVLLDDSAHVISVGRVRAYLWRRGEHQRLTPDNEGDPGSATGVLHGEPAHAQVALEPRDVLMLGSTTAFSPSAVAKVASVMQADAETPVSILATLMTEPAKATGAGAAAVVARVR
ncbi:MAG: hypothetical protein R3B40_08790 [Polyangiales bacterium]|nr:hypothetical protein [Myxococcales bacterium]MCB9656297.1 hypothetical protein [Sandaracinaceae bacterium]